MLCGRAMPLALHGFGAAATLASAGAADLAFSAAETQTYLERSGAPTTRLLGLAQRAEGWPAGLALIASSAALAHGSAAAAPDARDESTRRLLFDYLANDVLAEIAESERSFLLDSSILDRLEIASCGRILGRADAADILPKLAARGLFVSRVADDAFTYHQLFREFLRDELISTYAPEDVAALHARRRRLVDRRGDVVGAIGHLLDAALLEAAAGVLQATRS